MSHISLLGATADYELHKSIHICKGIMFLCLLPSSALGEDWWGLTLQRALEISHLKGHRGCRGDGEVYKAFGFSASTYGRSKYEDLSWCAESSPDLKWHSKEQRNTLQRWWCLHGIWEWMSTSARCKKKKEETTDEWHRSAQYNRNLNVKVAWIKLCCCICVFKTPVLKFKKEYLEFFPVAKLRFIYELIFIHSTWSVIFQIIKLSDRRLSKSLFGFWQVAGLHFFF